MGRGDEGFGRRLRLVLLQKRDLLGSLCLVTIDSMNKQWDTTRFLFIYCVMLLIPEDPCASPGWCLYVDAVYLFCNRLMHLRFLWNLFL